LFKHVLVVLGFELYHMSHTPSPFSFGNISNSVYAGVSLSCDPPFEEQVGEWREIGQVDNIVMEGKLSSSSHFFFLISLAMALTESA
jgi:hypothetical protein